ncbi:hypothetical protein [Haladaptatus halobius]|uniref:hypothetical protein n=1 Tax=Haladaptatus halobius TaxID=2884875 RepID=UPI001D09BFAF|nr:hypothetical protein [Haladaptatus halobius]
MQPNWKGDRNCRVAEPDSVARVDAEFRHCEAKCDRREYEKPRSEPSSEPSIVTVLRAPVVSCDERGLTSVDEASEDAEKASDEEQNHCSIDTHSSTIASVVE